MKKRAITFVIGLIVVIALGAASWRLSQPTEPVYQDEPLSYWLDQYDENFIGIEGLETPASNRDAAAVRAIGTNSFPILFKMLRAKDSPLAATLVDLARRQNAMTVSYQGAQSKNLQAVNAFKILGSAAGDATPVLMQIFEQNISPSSSEATALSLQGIGPKTHPAIPLLLRVALDTNEASSRRANAIVALGGIHASNKIVVPALVRLLNETNSIIRRVAAASLQKFDTHDSATALVRATRDADVGVRGNACYALQDARSATNIVIPVLLDCLNDPNANVREFAKRSLEKFASTTPADN